MPELDDLIPPKPPSESESGRYRRLKMGIPPRDADPQKLHRWRTFLGLSVYGLLGSAGLVITAMFVGLPLMGRLAWAEEQDRKVDSKIQAAVAPIERKVDELASKVDAQNQISKAFLAKVAEDSLVDTFAKMCKLEPFSEEWRKLNSDYQRFRDSYETATGRTYRELACRDIRTARP